MLINLSNHPSSKWSKEQTEAANREFGEIVDLPFPTVAPDGDEKYIAALAAQYRDKVVELACGEPATVHVMGEMTITFALVVLLQKTGFQCIASTTERLAVEFNDGTKEVKFRFVRFRKYQM